MIFGSKPDLQNLLWIFNFHPTNSYTDYRVGVEIPGQYQIVLDSDSKGFEGQGRIDSNGKYFTTDFRWNNRANFLQGCSSILTLLNLLVYIPSRVALVLAKVG
jgi:1,4-alpha-glucan branching enzyme